MNDSKQNTEQNTETVTVVAYDSKWPNIYEKERLALLELASDYFIEIEHIGSTAVPQQMAKPIIDIMAAIEELDALDKFLAKLMNYGFELIETGMTKRFFLRRIDNVTGQLFHLHIVSVDSWPSRKERLMRDYLLEHPKEVLAYGKLKLELAKQFPKNSLAYTEAKTDFIQNLLNKAYDKLGLERIDVWKD